VEDVAPLVCPAPLRAIRALDNHSGDADHIPGFGRTLIGISPES
jgi:hypothetical protein